MHSHVFGPNFQEKIFRFNFFISIIYLFIDTFVYYKGILAFILYHIMVQ